MWRRPAEELGRDYRVLAPDLPGFGASPGPFTLERATAGVAELIAAGPGRADVFGFSLGGTVALHLAATRPELVERLIVSGAAIAPAEQPLLVRAHRLIPDRLAQILFSDVRGDGWRALLGQLARIDIRGELPGISAPTLVVRGRWERAAGADARELAATIPAARAWTAPHLGHTWMLVSPRLFADVVRAYLA